LTFVLLGRQDALVSKEASRRALEAQLGGRLPRGLSVLSASELDDLAAALESARRRQAAALAEAGDRALARIPRLFRGPIRKIAG
jgi:hypothetical protein